MPVSVGDVYDPPAVPSAQEPAPVDYDPQASAYDSDYWAWTRDAAKDVATGKDSEKVVKAGYAKLKDEGQFRFDQSRFDSDFEAFHRTYKAADALTGSASVAASNAGKIAQDFADDPDALYAATAELAHDKLTSAKENYMQQVIENIGTGAVGVAQAHRDLLARIGGNLQQSTAPPGLSARERVVYDKLLAAREGVDPLNPVDQEPILRWSAKAAGMAFPMAVGATATAANPVIGAGEWATQIYSEEQSRLMQSGMDEASAQRVAAVSSTLQGALFSLLSVPGIKPATISRYIPVAQNAALEATKQATLSYGENMGLMGGSAALSKATEIMLGPLRADPKIDEAERQNSYQKIWDAVKQSISEAAGPMAVFTGAAGALHYAAGGTPQTPRETPQAPPETPQEAPQTPQVEIPLTPVGPAPESRPPQPEPKPAASLAVHEWVAQNADTPAMAKIREGKPLSRGDMAGVPGMSSAKARERFASEVRLFLEMNDESLQAGDEQGRQQVEGQGQEVGQASGLQGGPGPDQQAVGGANEVGGGNLGEQQPQGVPGGETGQPPIEPSQQGNQQADLIGAPNAVENVEAARPNGNVDNAERPSEAPGGGTEAAPAESGAGVPTGGQGPKEEPVRTGNVNRSRVGLKAAQTKVLKLHEKYAPLLGHFGPEDIPPREEDYYGGVSEDSTVLPTALTFTNDKEGRGYAKMLKDMLPKDLWFRVKIAKIGVPTTGEDIVAKHGFDNIVTAFQADADNAMIRRVRSLVKFAQEHPDQVHPEDLYEIQRYEAIRTAEDRAAAKKAKDAKPETIDVQTLNVGDKFTIAGEPNRVDSIDPDTGEVRIVDGITLDQNEYKPLLIDKGSLVTNLEAGADFEPAVQEYLETGDRGLFGQPAGYAGKQKGMDFGTTPELAASEKAKAKDEATKTYIHDYDITPGQTVLTPEGIETPVPKVEPKPANEAEVSALTDAMLGKEPTKKKSARRKKIEQSIAALEAKGTSIRAQLGPHLPGVGSAFAGVDPEVVGLYAKLLYNEVKKNGLKFVDVMLRIYEQAPEQFEAVKDKLVRGWNSLRKTNPDMEPAGDIDAVIAQAKAKATQTPTPPESAGTTALKNAVAAQDRRSLGMNPRGEVEPRPWEQALDTASGFDGESLATNTLIAELKEKPRAIDDIEGAMLLRRKRALVNARNEANNEIVRATEAKDDLRIATAEIHRASAEKQLSELIPLVEASGTATARGLAFRKAFLSEDFTLASMEKAEEAAAARPLTTEERARVKDEYEKLTKWEAALDAREKEIAQREAQAQAEAVIEKAKEQAIKKPPTPEQVKEPTRVEAARAEVDAAWKEFGEKALGKLFANPIDPEVLAAAAKLVKAYIKLGVANFADFMSKVREKIGDEKAQKAEEAFKQAWDREKEKTLRPLKPGELERQYERRQRQERNVRAGKKSATRTLAKELVRDAIRKGITEREAVFDYVHERLSKLIKDLPRTKTIEAIGGYGDFRPLNKEETEVKAREIQRQAQLVSKLQDMQEGRAPKRSGVEREPRTDEERRLEQQVKEAQRRGGFKVLDPERQLKSAQAARETALRNRISDRRYEIKTQQRIVRERSAPPSNEKIRALEAELAEVNKEHLALFGKRKLTEAQRNAAQERALDRAINDIEAQLKAGDLTPKKKVAKPDTPAIAAKRAKLEYLKSIRDELRELDKPKVDPEAAKLARYKRKLAGDISKLKDRLAKNDIEPPPKKPPMKLDKEATDLKYELQTLRAERSRRLDALRRERRPGLIKSLEAIPEGAGILKALKASFDLSAIGNQGGWFARGDPRLIGNAFSESIKAIKSDKEAFAVNERILARENAKNGLYARAKLFLAQLDGELSKREEAFMAWVVKKIPGLVHSERQYIAYLNVLRADKFDQLLALHPDPANITDADLRIIGNYVNTGTGRGNLGSFERAAQVLAHGLFSPRNFVSKIQLLMGQPLYHQFGKGSWEVRKIIAKDYARSLVGSAAFYGLTLSALYALGAKKDQDYSLTFDPRSSDFGKFRFGNATVDPMAGLSQSLVLMTRLVTGQTRDRYGNVQYIRGPLKPREGMDADKLVWSFIQNKASPAVGLAMAFARQKFFGDKPVTVGTALEETFLPLVMQDTYEAIKDLGVPKGTALGLLSLLGLGVQSYEGSEKKSLAQQYRETGDKDALTKAVQAGEISREDKHRIITEAKESDIVQKLKAAGVSNALEWYESASESQRTDEVVKTIRHQLAQTDVRYRSGQMSRSAHDAVIEKARSLGLRARPADAVLTR